MAHGPSRSVPRGRMSGLARDGHRLATAVSGPRNQRPSQRAPGSEPSESLHSSAWRPRERREPSKPVLDQEEEAFIATLRQDYGKTRGTYYLLLRIIDKLQTALYDQERDYKLRLRVVELELQLARSKQG